ncbi:hypothetical protein EKL30_00090 [Candidimonas sp. SYP-B2681]|uniref:hypothetical protein n=1 Tax=Candidimonas sp. SYP-B2681 TaxID=2497686 RepID=UPI000F87853B|nr:hypothetical protein [Candidimonas sp. SYP-B2681]RTZ47456.1 hypothetical protein EKL30_00090 [Candidimonas sp. SYP-B2681]
MTDSEVLPVALGTSAGEVLVLLPLDDRLLAGPDSLTGFVGVARSTGVPALEGLLFVPSLGACLVPALPDSALGFVDSVCFSTPAAPDPCMPLVPWAHTANGALKETENSVTAMVFLIEFSR